MVQLNNSERSCNWQKVNTAGNGAEHTGVVAVKCQGNYCQEMKACEVFVPSISASVSELSVTGGGGNTSSSSSSSSSSRERLREAEKGHSRLQQQEEEDEEEEERGIKEERVNERAGEQMDERRRWGAGEMLAK
ncbi:unnamed protein product [Pleuronectes platessa]|uniref:Uncharacterized protein n=1 Tax=Pleuronectes platessa TaxID=8262 RepID=A0A9N7YN39_PLEPL|nr:unnamed protein product [Pleuronectes platessa]